MIKTLTTSVALLALGMGVGAAADLPAIPAPLYAPPPFSWTGFYLGGNLGAGWAQSSVTDTLFGLDLATAGTNGVFIGGGQLGANYQFGGAVAGVEWDFDWAANNNNSAGVGFFVPTVGNIQVTSNNTWMSTLALRLGFVLEDRLFVYGKAGAGWAGNNGFTLTNTTAGASITPLNGNTDTGWVAGVGFEWAFTNNWTTKLEYDYLALSSRTFTVTGTVIPSLAGDTFATGSRNIQMVKLGVNYLFNWLNPLVTRY